MNIIAFDLVTPMVSWAVSGSSVVPSMATPTWSAIVGMLGAALGIPRDDDKLVGIAADYALAVRVEALGTKQYDYHTVQSPSAGKVKAARPRTRAQELTLGTEEDVNTSITRREYLHDARYRMFIVQLAQAPEFSAECIVEALRHPVYPLYVGRRSCLVGRLDAGLTGTEELNTATHWDKHISLDKPASMIAERRDLLIGKREFGIRHECIG